MNIKKVFSELLLRFNEGISMYTSPDKIEDILGNIIIIALILIITKVVIKFIKVLIDKFFDEKNKLKLRLEENKVNTLKSILKSLTTYGIYFIAYSSIFEIIGIPIRALITAAGIGGLAIGFGAQNLVRDIITGFFILFEDQFTVGDYIEIDGKTGVVEEMALRITKIRDFSGDLHIIPNGSISKVTNRCRGNMRAKVEISIAYEENIERAIQVLNSASEGIKKENNNIIEGPIVLGVTKLGEYDVVITIITKVKPMSQWAVEALMRKRFKEAFDAEGIEIPYPKRVIYK